MKIGKNIRRERLTRDYSQERLARKVDMSRNQIDRLERGEQGTRSEVIIKLAAALNIPTFKLLMSEKEWAKWRGICQDSEPLASTQLSATG